MSWNINCQEIEVWRMAPRQSLSSASDSTLRFAWRWSYFCTFLRGHLSRRFLFRNALVRRQKTRVFTFHQVVDDGLIRRPGSRMFHMNHWKTFLEIFLPEEKGRKGGVKKDMASSSFHCCCCCCCCYIAITAGSLAEEDAGDMDKEQEQHHISDRSSEVAAQQK